MGFSPMLPTYTMNGLLNIYSDIVLLIMSTSFFQQLGVVLYRKKPDTGQVTIDNHLGHMGCHYHLGNRAFLGTVHLVGD